MTTISITSLGKRPHTRLGRLLAKRMPDIAQQLLDEYSRECIPPQETDFNRLEVYLQRFAKANNLDHYELRGRLHRPAKTDVRRVYIACMLHLYNPQVFLQPSSDILMVYGFTRNLAQVLILKEQNVSQYIREVILQERVYTDFKDKVSETLATLTQQEVSHGGA